MLSIRLSRKGRKHEPHYRIVVQEKARSAKSGMSTEELGHWNATSKDLAINADRARYWISQGAQPSQTVARLMVRNGIAEAGKFVKTVAGRGTKAAA